PLFVSVIAPAAIPAPSSALENSFTDGFHYHPGGRLMRLRNIFSGVLILAVVPGVFTALSLRSSPLAASSVTRQIESAGTSSLQTGDFTPSEGVDVTQAKFPGQADEAAGPGPYPGRIVNRSFSTGTGPNVSVHGGKKAKSHPLFNTGFEGLNFYQQRYARGG